MTLIVFIFIEVSTDSLLGGGEVKTPASLLNWDVVQKKMPWNILLLLGGAFALAKGSEVHTSPLKVTDFTIILVRHSLIISAIN